MTQERVQKSPAWNSTASQKPDTHLFGSRPFATQAQLQLQSPPTQTEIEAQEFEQNKYEVTGLELQEKYGTITPKGQQRLALLRAKMNTYWQERRKAPSHTGFYYAKIAAIHGAASAPPQQLQKQLPIAQPQNQSEQKTTQITSDQRRSNIEERLDKGQIGEAVVAIDDMFTQDFLAHHGGKVRGNAESLEAIQKRLSLADKQTGNTTSAIIYVYIREKQLELIIVPSEGEPIHKKQTVDRETLLKQRDVLGDRITKPYVRGDKHPAFQIMYNLLIKPLEDELKQRGINNLIFSMEQELQIIPIAALRDGGEGGKYLIEKFSLALTPSFQMTDTNYESLHDSSVLAMGASQFSELSNLPFVATELQTITSITQNPTDDGKNFLNSDFTLENLKKQYPEFGARIVHIATHGGFEADEKGNATESYLAGSANKKMIELQDMQRIDWGNIPPELLVLSNCKGGLGSKKAEFGMAGAGLASGASSVLSGLWAVDDQATLELMREFYQQLQQKGVTKAQALQQAQIAMLKLEKHPRLWAAFMQLGSSW
jgi:CHAT domain-containing protein